MTYEPAFNRLNMQIVALKSGLRRPMTPVLVAAVVSLLLPLLLTGYMQLTHRQFLSDRDTAMDLRSLVNGLKRSDALVMDSLAHREHPFETFAFARSLHNLSNAAEQIDAHRPPPDKIGNDVAEIEAGWVATIQLLNSDRERAAKAYAENGTMDRVTKLTKAMEAELAAVEPRLHDKEMLVDRMVTGTLMIQLLAGALCVWLLYSGTKRSKREAVARIAAVTESNTSREQMTRLFHMADMLQSAIDHQDANEVLKSSAAELIFGFSGALYVFNNSRDRLVLSTTWEREGFEPLPETLAIDQCWALKRGKPNINRPHTRKLCCKHHTSSDYALEIPMLARGEVLGLLQIYAEGDEAEQRLERIKGLGAALADAMSLALSNIALREKLRGQALRDPLTGLYNRRYMEDAIDRFVRLAEREKRDLSVIMIDLDHFKRLNDQHGHAKGDSVLRDSAAVITRALRDTDVACRYGGEELIVLLPGCNVEMAMSKAEQIRNGIEHLSEPNGATVTASMGVAAFSQQRRTAREIIAEADAALYRAKQAGRNRVMCTKDASPKSCELAKSTAEKAMPVPVAAE